MTTIYNFVEKLRSLSEWCGHYGAAVMVRTLWCGDSMVLFFYGARQYGAMVPRFFLLFGIFGGPYKGRFVD